jgi:hypothetical protein
MTIQDKIEKAIREYVRDGFEAQDRDEILDDVQETLRFFRIEAIPIVFDEYRRLMLARLTGIAGRE